MDNRFEEQVKGAILGFAVADALGVPGEFMRRAELAEDPIVGMRGGGAHGQKAGTWSDDTSMTICLMVTLTIKGFDCEDLMYRFCKWLWDADYTARGEIFDVGGTVKKAIFNFSRGAKALESGEDGEHSCGNGSLMRILPLPLYLWAKGMRALDDETAALIHDVSRVTHAHPRCLAACGIYCAVVWEIMNGETPADAVAKGVEKALAYYRAQPGFEVACEDYASLTGIAGWTLDQVSGRGYVVTTLQSSLWAFATTGSYAECALTCANLGHDTDTIAAIAGGLAGLYYGMEAIPIQWLDVLAREKDLEKLCDAFAEKAVKTAL